MHVVILSLYMQYIKGTDRTQAVLFPQSLDEIIDPDNEVRIIDLFVESIDLAEFKFHLKCSAEGRPPYHPKDLLKCMFIAISTAFAHQELWKKNVKETLK